MDLQLLRATYGYKRGNVGDKSESGMNTHTHTLLYIYRYEYDNKSKLT